MLRPPRSTSVGQTCMISTLSRIDLMDVSLLDGSLIADQLTGANLSNSNLQGAGACRKPISPTPI
ncbi:MAG: hypothetical protein J2P48_07175 [Alphaproteobacteria bacterium]|nr:hypothetical protein [Alphaproteobacteria bacterium]